jgi:GNAT superfamily N-acetyltransferase
MPSLVQGSELLPLQAYHLDDVLELEGQIQQYARSNLSITARKDLLRRFIHWSNEGRSVCKVLEDPSHQLLGYFLLVCDPTLIETFFSPRNQNLVDCAYLAQIVILKELQGQGVGTWLMRAVEAETQNQGKTTLLLEVHSQSQAYSWYQKLDYQEVCSQVFMAKNLPLYPGPGINKTT